MIIIIKPPSLIPVSIARYIHIVDTVMLDDSPPWSLTSGDVSALPPLPLLVTVVTALAMAR